MPFRFLPVLLTLALICVFSPVNAQDGGDQQDSSFAQGAAAKAKAEVLKEKVSSTLKELSVDESQHFFVIYTNFTVYSMVHAVREDIQNAVTQCSANNPEMESKLVDRFDLWDSSVSATMEEARDNIDNLTLAQNYLPKSEFDTIFSMLIEVRSADDSQFEAIPVTTPEACEFMLSKMDETQESMNQLLQFTLVSYPSLMQKTQK